MNASSGEDESITLPSHRRENWTAESHPRLLGRHSVVMRVQDVSRWDRMRTTG